jgi:phosphoribosylamine--glycine ligase
MMRLLKSDLLPVLMSAAKGALAGARLQWSDEACALIVMASQGYPGAYKKGSPIDGVEAAGARDGVVIFHAGTKLANGRLVAEGGRVLNISATGRSIRDAVAAAYSAVGDIDWPDGFCRRDIAWRALRSLV